MSFTIQNMEFYLLVLMRISGFVFTAPFFSYSSIPIRMKAAASFILAIVAIQMVPVVSVSYQGVFGFSIIKGNSRWNDSWVYVQFVFLYHKFCGTVY